jgi:hypothetical protein
MSLASRLTGGRTLENRFVDTHEVEGTLPEQKRTRFAQPFSKETYVCCLRSSLNNPHELLVLHKACHPERSRGICF